MRLLLISAASYLLGALVSTLFDGLWMGHYDPYAGHGGPLLGVPYLDLFLFSPFDPWFAAGSLIRESFPTHGRYGDLLLAFIVFIAVTKLSFVLLYRRRGLRKKTGKVMDRGEPFKQ